MLCFSCQTLLWYP
ncbi:MAG: hypothetical protein E7596_06045 [Ruminococcaceae bacterium]|nr:hypothetical protein [Oscillospiraceae bacterium]